MGLDEQHAWMFLLGNVQEKAHRFLLGLNETFSIPRRSAIAQADIDKKTEIRPVE